MLSSEELTAWYERLNFSPETRSVIDRVRSSEPARRVGGGRGNVSGRYPSRKMGMTIQFESHRVRTRRHLRNGARRFGRRVLRPTAFY